MKVNIDIHRVEIHPKQLKALKEFVAFAAEKLKCKEDIQLFLLEKDHNVDGISTAAYNITTNDVHVRYGGRALVDVLRSIAHEFGHARQKELGELEDKDIPNIGGHIEDDANAAAGRLIKMFVDENNARWIYKL